MYQNMMSAMPRQSGRDANPYAAMTQQPMQQPAMQQPAMGTPQATMISQQQGAPNPQIQGADLSFVQGGGGTPARTPNAPNMGFPAAQQPNIWDQSAGAYNQALSGTQAAMSQYASNPIAQGRASTYSAMTADPARQLADTNLDPYMNPYTSNVIDQNAQDMERARLIQQNQANDAMMQAGAFGGSRHGIANAETNRGFYDRLGAMSGQLRNQGYMNAQNAAFQDIGNEMGMNQYNTTAQNQARAQNAQNRTDVSMSNADMMNQQNNTRFGNMLSGAAQMSGLAGQGFGFANTLADRQMQDGNISRGIQQDVINDGRAQYDQWRNAGNLGLPALQGFLDNNYGSTTTNSKSPGLMDFAKLAASF